MHKFFIIIFFVFLVAGGAFFYVYRAVAYSYLRQANLIPRPEVFTELYFDDHMQLPSQIESGTSYSFSFVVHNLEHRQMRYPYEVFVLADGQKQVFDSHTLTLSQGAYQTVSEHFLLASPSAMSEIVVLLKNKSQQIDFWASRRD